MLFSFWKKKKAVCDAPAPPTDLGLPDFKWLLIPLGNPGGEYAATRHNLGRLMVQRWMDAHCPAPALIQSFNYGAAYSLGSGLGALVPNTYMNHSGRVVAEALKIGFPRERMMVVHDDKDLPLGAGRLSFGGGAAGHGGVQDILNILASTGGDVARLRLGLAPFERPLRDWVLGEWLEDEWGAIEKMDAPFAAVMSMLSNGIHLADVQGRVNRAAFWAAPTVRQAEPPN